MARTLFQPFLLNVHLSINVDKNVRLRTRLLIQTTWSLIWLDSSPKQMLSLRTGVDIFRWLHVLLKCMVNVIGYVANEFSVFNEVRVWCAYFLLWEIRLKNKFNMLAIYLVPRKFTNLVNNRMNQEPRS